MCYVCHLCFCFNLWIEFYLFKPLTDNTCLILETSFYQVDREELQIVTMRGKKLPKVQDIIEESRTLDASPSASDREDSISSFSFSSKRRRRSYTLAFKLEVFFSPYIYL